MVQQFELDPTIPAEDQIRETEFNILKGVVNIFYHYGKGKIVAKEKQFLRADLIGKSQHDDGLSDKDVVEDAKSQQQKIIHKMEIECHMQIKN